MLYGPKSLTLPNYNSLKHLEARGNYAIRKYYHLPYAPFYRKKLRMIVDLLKNNWAYHNIMDYGAGPGIFTDELKKHALFVKSYEQGDLLNPMWKFDVVVCASVLEFCPLDFTLKTIKRLLKPDGKFILASPMDTKFSRAYFKFIKDKNIRHSHTTIIDKVNQYFAIEKKVEWLGLYFALRAS